MMTRTEDDAFIVIDVDHGYVDDRGRAIGGRAKVGVREFREFDKDTGTFVSRGHSLITRALRAGHEFGVASVVTYHSSVQVAEDYAQRALAAQAKRFRKRYGVVP